MSKELTQDEAMMQLEARAQRIGLTSPTGGHGWLTRKDYRMVVPCFRIWVREDGWITYIDEKSAQLITVSPDMVEDIHWHGHVE